MNVFKRLPQRIVLDEMWPDYNIEEVYRTLSWYQDQDITLGG
jgi:undecaprenyl pyrophosphate synthase